MKTLQLLIVLFLFTGIYNVGATDRLVNEAGSGGAYTSISAAITASSDGDRIIIQPKSGGSPYIENFTVGKSLQFLCETESGQFAVQGVITVSPATPKEIVFIGMQLTGGMSSSGNAPVSSRTKMKILYCNITGNINFGYDNYDMTIANCVVVGDVTIRSGRLIANDISNTTDGNLVTIGNEGSGTALHMSDTIQVIGNRLYTPSTVGAALYAVTTNYFYEIKNNYVRYMYRGLYISSWTSNTVGTNEISNNTVSRAFSNASTNTSIYCSNLTTNAVLNIYNNLLNSVNTTATEYGLYFSAMTAGVSNVNYNYTNNGYNYSFYGLTVDGTNQINQTFTVDPSSGEPVSGTFADLGHPAVQYTDLDLTRNNLGCYGGSYSMENYFPSGDSNHNRVYRLKMPRSVYFGNSIAVEAEGFDK